MALICGCPQHREQDAIAEAENAAHHATFDRQCDAKAGKFVELEPDHETGPRTRLALMSCRPSVAMIYRRIL